MIRTSAINGRSSEKTSLDPASEVVGIDSAACKSSASEDGRRLWSFAARAAVTMIRHHYRHSPQRLLPKR